MLALPKTSVAVGRRILIDTEMSLVPACRWASLVAQWSRIHLQCRRCRKCGFNPWVWKISWRRAWQPTPVFLPGESPGPEEPGGLQSMGLQSQSWLTGLSRQACTGTTHPLYLARAHAPRQCVLWTNDIQITNGVKNAGSNMPFLTNLQSHPVPCLQRVWEAW